MPFIMLRDGIDYAAVQKARLGSRDFDSRRPVNGAKQTCCGNLFNATVKRRIPDPYNIMAIISRYKNTDSGGFGLCRLKTKKSH
jgi:hypothetical protein